MSDLRDQLQKTLGGTYTLERELGGGGMSRVFVAEETSLGRKVVVKVLPPDLAAAVNLERFRREIQMAAKLQHPHIVPVLAAGVSEGLPYYTMPFIEGETLRARLSRGGELPIHDAVRILRDTLSALSYAHEHGVVHRDIKPDNILLTGGHAVVADFGVAKAISASTNPGASLTSLGVALGTPAYMSPEQAAADPTTDHRSDLYSVGAVAYEMLSGQQVFSARSPQAMLAAHAMETPEPIEKRRKSVPPLLAALIMRSLEKHAADRPQSAGEMLAQLDAAVTPSAATTPYTGTMPARKVTSSGRSMWMSIAAAAVLLVLGSSSWYWYKSKQPSTGAAAADGSTADSTASLAVLPFENLGKPDDAYFADGMTEEISSRLGELSGLRVIGRQSVRGYANSNKTISQIGKELGVAYVLTGSVRWDKSVPGKSRVRVSPALLRTSDGSQVWSEPYEDEVSGVFQIQSKVAQRVADALKIQLNRGEQQTLAARPTDNVEAYELYLRGQAAAASNYSGADYLRAVGLFEKAVALDPKFAEAWHALADAHVDAYWFRGDPSEQRLAMARATLDKLVALKPDDAGTHDALGNFYYHGKLDYARALDEFSKAQALSPNDATASALKARVERRQGKWTEAIADMRHAVSLDPRNVFYVQDLAETLTFTRQYAEAESYARKAIGIAPDEWTAYNMVANIRLYGFGDVQGTLATLRDASSKVNGGDLGLGLVAMAFPIYRDPQLAALARESAIPTNDGDRVAYYWGKVVLAIYSKDDTGKRVAADSVLKIAPRAMKGSFSDADALASSALAYAALGDREHALAAARRSIDMVPVSRDALRGATNTVGLAYVAALVGDKDLAISTLRQALAIPSNMSVQLLRIDPWWDSLRSDARFQALIAGN